MIRRKQRTEKQKALLSYKVSAPVGLGATRADEWMADAQAESEHIRVVRRQVFWLHRTCQLCHGARRAAGDDHMHEDPSRAETRGLPLDERFSLTICGRVCSACHLDITENRLGVVFEDPIRRWLGRVYSVPMLPKGTPHEDE